jgi:hypothetical protein
LKRYFDLSFQSTHITIDDEGMDAMANQMELDTSPMEISRTNLPFHLPIDQEKPLSSVASALSAEMPIEDNGRGSTTADGLGLLWDEHAWQPRILPLWSSRRQQDQRSHG